MGLVGNGGLAALLHSDHADMKSVAGCYREIGCEEVADAYRDAIEAGVDESEKLKELSMIVFLQERDVTRKLGAYLRKNEAAFASTRPSAGENIKDIRNAARKPPPRDASVDEIVFWLECIGASSTRQNDEPAETPEDGNPEDGNPAGGNPIVAISLSSRRNSTDEELRQLGQYPALRNGLQGLDLGNTDLSEQGIKELVKFPDLRSLSLAETRVQDDWLNVLEGMNQLEELDLDRTAISDEGMEPVGKIISLSSLMLDNLNITDRGIAKLAALKNLKTLSLTSTKVGDGALQTIGGFTALQNLDLWEARLSGSTLKPLRNCRDLDMLTLTGMPITDAALAELESLGKLTYLYLDKTNVNGSAFAKLTDLPRLEGLFLYETPFTDEGARHLKSFATLRELSIHSDKLSDAAVPHLAELTELRNLTLESPKLQGGPEFRALEALKSLEYISLPERLARSADIQDLIKKLPKTRFSF